MRKTLVLLLGLAVLAALAVPALGLGGGDGRKVIDANVLAPVTEPYTGTANPIRGVPGGGLPWELESGSANLRADGRLHVKVRGLVLARRETTCSAGKRAVRCDTDAGLDRCHDNPQKSW